MSDPHPARIFKKTISHLNSHICRSRQECTFAVLSGSAHFLFQVCGLKKLHKVKLFIAVNKMGHQGPVVQSIVSLTSSLRVISLTVLADSIYNILIFFAEKM